MTRYFVLVLFPEHLTDEEADAYVRNTMLPYHDWFENFPAYRYPCFCTGVADFAESPGNSANAEIGDFRRLWLQYEHIPLEQRPAWSDYIAPWEEIAELAAQVDPLYQAPQSDCSKCNGSGLSMTTWASGGHFDYWRILEDGATIRFPSPTIWPIGYLLTCFATIECGVLITLDGVWHQSTWGNWAAHDPAWQREAVQLLHQFPNAMGIRVLCHD